MERTARQRTDKTVSVASLLTFGPTNDPDQWLEVLALDVEHTAAANQLPIFFLHQGPASDPIAIDQAVAGAAPANQRVPAQFSHGLIVPPSWGIGVLMLPGPAAGEETRLRWLAITLRLAVHAMTELSR